MYVRPEREEQALREVGRTGVSRIVAATLVGLFLATLAVVPVLEPVLSESSAVREAALDIVPEAMRTGQREGPLAANQALLAGMTRFEEALENRSFLRRAILPTSQRLLTDWLGVGNEQVYLGLDGWLFFRDDFDHVTGPGFLEPRVLKRAHLESARAPNPLPAILQLHRDLETRDIQLVVVPTPVKLTVHPEFMARRASAEHLAQNPSFRRFLDELDQAGILVFDPAAVFADAKARDAGPLYLKTDTHWNPRAVEIAARGLATALDAGVAWRQDRGEPLLRRPVSVSGLGDTTRMLEPGAGEDGGPSENSDPHLVSETTEVSRVTTRRGRPWRPSRNAEVLLLGDSFTNIYSDATLGWGTGAGLAEQLSFELGRPVDRIALNAGGAWSARQALARTFASTERTSDRLGSTRVVVYQFATRELSQGDWKLIRLPELP